MRLKDISFLLVDSHSDANEILSFILQEQGGIVVSASSAHEALQVMTRYRPNILITAMMLPEMDGFSLLHRIRADSTQNIIAILTTCYTTKDIWQKAVETGFNFCFSVPIDYNTLIECIVCLL